MKVGPARRYLTLCAGAIVSTLTAMVAVAQTNHVTVSPGEIFRFGDTRNMDCTVQMKITGSLPAKASAITDIRIHRAMDDKGKDLRGRAVGVPQMRIFNQSGWLAVLQLKSPGESAKTIREITGEIDLALPTVENGGLFKVTNFMANPGQTIHAASLAKHGIKLTFHTFESYADFHRAKPKKYVNDMDLQIERSCFSGIYGSPTNPPRTSVALQVDDPNGLLLGFGFETSDGQRVQGTGTCSFPNFRCYHFKQPPPPDLNLIVTVAAPGVIRTEPFVLENVWLPWDRSPGSPYLDPPDLQATAELQIWEGKRWTNRTLNVTFIGGPIPTADGIRRVTLLRATDGVGNSIPLPSNPGTKNLTPVESGRAPKRARTSLHLGALPNLQMLKSVEGEVEVFTPTAENGGRLVLSNLLAFSGMSVPLPAAAASATKVHFAGPVDFGELETTLRKSAGIISQGSRVINPTNSLRFDIENPEAHFVKLAFRGPDGSEVHPVRTLRSDNIVVYNFREPPRADLQLVVDLATPEAMRPYRFRINDVPVTVPGL